jgi:uncharacterized protein
MEGKMSSLPVSGWALFATLALGLWPAGDPVSAVEPSFDCSQASGEVEELICTDADLATLDRKLAEIWKEALAGWPQEEVAAQRAFQRGWIKGRNDCWKAEDKRRCVEESYRTRIVEIQIQSGQLEVPAVVGFDCPDAEHKPFTVVFYQQTEPPSAVITYGDDQVIAFLAPSGSGARYVAANVEFWEHQGEATVDWFGTQLVCRPRQ